MVILRLILIIMMKLKQDKFISMSIIIFIIFIVRSSKTRMFLSKYNLIILLCL